MPFSLHAQGCKPNGLFVGKAGCVRLARHVPYLGSAAGKGPGDEAFIPQFPLEDPGHFGVHNIVVRIDRSRNHRFAEPRGSIDDSFPAPAGQWVGREHHSGGPGVNHPLDHDGEGYFVRLDPQRGPVGHCPVCPEGCPTVPHGLKDGADAYDIQVGVLLAGEARERKVLCRGGGPYRHRSRFSQRLICLLDGGNDPRRNRGGADGLACFAGHPGKFRGPAGRSRGKGSLEPAQLCERAVLHGPGGLPVGRCGQAEPVRHGQPGCYQLTEVGCLASDLWKHAPVHLAEAKDQGRGGVPGLLAGSLPGRS